MSKVEQFRNRVQANLEKQAAASTDADLVTQMIDDYQNGGGYDNLEANLEELKRRGFGLAEEALYHCHSPNGSLSALWGLLGQIAESVGVDRVVEFVAYGSRKTADQFSADASECSKCGAAISFDPDTNKWADEDNGSTTCAEGGKHSPTSPDEHRDWELIGARKQGATLDKGPRDFWPEVLVQQVGRMNILSISGGRVENHSNGIRLPVAYGYAVDIFLEADDTYTVETVFTRSGVTKVVNSIAGIYAEQVGEAAYQASLFRDKPWEKGGSRKQGLSGLWRWEEWDVWGEPAKDSGMWTARDSKGQEVATVELNPEGDWTWAVLGGPYEKIMGAGETATLEEAQKAAEFAGIPFPGQQSIPFDRAAARKRADISPTDVGVKVGDIFVATWGYDQTNVDFYEITGLTAASVRVRKLQKTYTESGAMSMAGKSVPRPGQYSSGEVTKRLQWSGYSNEPEIKVGYQTWATPWDGQPEYESHYASKTAAEDEYRCSVCGLTEAEVGGEKDDGSCPHIVMSRNVEIEGSRKQADYDPEMAQLGDMFQHQFEDMKGKERADTLPCPEHKDKEATHEGTYASFPSSYSEYHCPEGHDFKVKVGTTREDILAEGKRTAVLQIRQKNYRGQEGWVISGKVSPDDAFAASVFVPGPRSNAEIVKANLIANKDNVFEGITTSGSKKTGFLNALQRGVRRVLALDPQSGYGDSSLPDVEEDTPDDDPMWPWEIGEIVEEVVEEVTEKKSSLTNVWANNGFDPFIALEDTNTDETMWPVEFTDDGPDDGEDAADVALVPTPGRDIADYPQPHEGAWSDDDDAFNQGVSSGPYYPPSRMWKDSDAEAGPCQICGGAKSDPEHQETAFGGIDHEFVSEQEEGPRFGSRKTASLSELVSELNAILAESRYGPIDEATAQRWASSWTYANFDEWQDATGRESMTADDAIAFAISNAGEIAEYFIDVELPDPELEKEDEGFFPMHGASHTALTLDPDKQPDDQTPAFGWELPETSADPNLGQGAADVADVPTPGDALDGSYPQPSTTSANTDSVNSELDDALEVEADEEVEDKEPKTSSRRHGFTPSHHLMMPGPGGVLRYVECSPIGGLGDGEFVTCLLEDGSRVKAYAGHLSPIYATQHQAVTDTCTQCGKQIHEDEQGTWVDNSGGDVCGVEGGNEPHKPSYTAARSDYEHWNEEADAVWWAEEGSQPLSEEDPDEFNDEDLDEEDIRSDRDSYYSNLKRVGEWYDEVGDDKDDKDESEDKSEDKGDSDESEDSDEGSDDSDGDAPVESEESAPEEEKEDSGEEESTDEPSDDEKKEAFRATVQANLRMERR